MEYDEFDEYICKSLFYIVGVVKTFYKLKVRDLGAKKELGVISKEEYLKQIKSNDYIEDTKDYYFSLCTPKLEKLGFTSNNDSFERIFNFNTDVFNKMVNEKHYRYLVPYFTQYLIPTRKYEEIKENIKRELEIENQTEESEDEEISNL